MSDTRKAVVTTEQVRASLAEYLSLRLANGVTEAVPGSLEFDKGARGKGFATYKGNDVVASFETKEEALSFYSTWVEVAKEVLSMVADKPVAEIGAKKLTKASDKPAA